MARTVKIADAHSRKNPKQVLTLELSGGDPWYSYVWINDVCHVVTLDEDTKQVKIERQR